MKTHEPLPTAVPQQQTPAGGSGVSLTVSPRAFEKIKEFAAAKDEYKGKMFRVYIEGGGCSGFQYGFSFDEERDGDTRVEAGDTAVLVDPQSAMYLNGSELDFVDDLRGSGFVVKNPNATGSCGCGLSFSV